MSSATSRTLFLTSPHMRGPDVTELQQALKQNQFGVFLEGAADGEFGPETMRAVKRAQYWLGYASPRAVNGVAGPRLLPILEGRQKLRPEQRRRRDARIKAKPKTPLRVKAMRAMLAAPDEKERPAGSNNCSTSRWYGMRGPWCAMDVTRFYVKAGSLVFRRGARYAYVPYLLGDARRGVPGLSMTANPQFGDIVVVDWQRDGVFDHTGLFEKWLDRAGGRFRTREGNTGIGNDSNGGQRMTRDRRLSDGRFLFVHVSR